MSREKVEMIRAFYEAFNRRAFDQVATYAHPDFEIKPLPALSAMTGDQIKGYEEARRFWSSFFDGFDQIQVEPREIVEVGDMVVGDLHWRGRGRSRRCRRRTWRRCAEATRPSSGETGRLGLQPSPRTR
jgi:ketosteroid isomerase-like protein